MALFDQVTRILALEPWREPVQARTGEELNEAIAALRRSPRPWRSATVADALGVPAIFRAVSLIANTAGALSLDAFRDGMKLPAADRPRLIVRPNPFTTPRTFYRDTAYSLVTRGESWWWVAARDINGLALSLVPVPPEEVVVEADPTDLRTRRVTWRGRVMPNEDMRQITYLRDPGQLRGMGPLQACGAAISVSVESQEWAANFFATGGNPSVNLHSDLDLDANEANALRDQWVSTPPNMPQVTSGSISLRDVPRNTEGAQMLQAREYQVGDVSRMFGIPASLLDHSIGGSSLTYQNLEMEFARFIRTGLWPNVLEAIEQEISDLLTRSTVARFNLDALQRADSGTRFKNWSLALGGAPFMELAEVRAAEGLAPGDTENSPIPFGSPQAFPATVPTDSVAVAGRSEALGPFRCPTCARKLAETASAGTVIRCRCGVLATA